MTTLRTSGDNGYTWSSALPFATLAAAVAYARDWAFDGCRAVAETPLMLVEISERGLSRG